MPRPSCAAVHYLVGSQIELVLQELGCSLRCETLRRSLKSLLLVGHDDWRAITAAAEGNVPALLIAPLIDS